MGQSYLIDSNVLIDYASGRIPAACTGFIEQVFEQQLLISVIVKIEVLGFDDIPGKVEAMEEFVG